MGRSTVFILVLSMFSMVQGIETRDLFIVTLSEDNTSQDNRLTAVTAEVTDTGDPFWIDVEVLAFGDDSWIPEGIYGPTFGPGGWFFFNRTTGDWFRMNLATGDLEFVSTTVDSFSISDIAFSPSNELWMVGWENGQYFLRKVDWTNGAVLFSIELQGSSQYLYIAYHGNELFAASEEQICRIVPSTGASTVLTSFDYLYIVEGLASDGEHLWTLAAQAPPAALPYSLCRVNPLNGEYKIASSYAPWIGGVPLGMDLMLAGQRAPSVDTLNPVGLCALTIIIAFTAIMLIGRRH